MLLPYWYRLMAKHDQCISFLPGHSMSLPCLLGMHDIIWHNSGSSSFHHRNHVRSLDKTRMNPTRPAANNRQNIDGFTRPSGSKNHSSNNLEFLLRSSENSQDSFHSGKWSVSDGSQQEVTHFCKHAEPSKLVA